MQISSHFEKKKFNYLKIGFYFFQIQLRNKYFVC